MTPFLSSARGVHRWIRALAVVGLGALLLLGVVLGWLKWHENDLVFNTALSHARPLGPLPATAERLTIPEAAGEPLAAIVFPAASTHDSGFWVLHLHGNADSAFSVAQIRHCQSLRSLGLNVLSFDYRGFGLSPGVASEAHIYEDAEAAYQMLLGRGIPPERIIIWGHSLGSGPAVYLASKHAAAALVLFGAFTSLADAAADSYPHLPVRWMVSIHFDSLARMPQIHMPVVIAHSVGDTLIPYRHALRLFAAANAPKRLLTLDVASADGLGGHFDALYDHLGLLAPPLATLIGAPLAAVPTP
jgi:alpha-beta hydrolase superfamily lysophospholipase